MRPTDEPCWFAVRTSDEGRGELLKLAGVRNKGRKNESVFPTRFQRKDVAFKELERLRLRARRGLE